jgi:hypothetical protein
MDTTRVGARAGAVLACLTLLLASACSGSDSDKEPAGTPTGSSSAEPAALEATLGKVEGRLKPAAAAAEVAAIGPVVDGWFDAAYVGGKFPRTDFGDAFPGFTPGAVKDARKDIALMTNVQSGADITSVTTDDKTVAVDLLAAKQKAAGATARFTLDFTTAGTAPEEVRVKGQLFLTRDTKNRWRIFGYNVTRSIR